MTFVLNQGPLAIQIPGGQYSNQHYAPSPAQYYADSPAFSTFSAESPYCTVHQPGVHHPDEDPRSPWAEHDPYWSASSFVHGESDVSRPSPMMIQCPELPLHAPAPIPGQSSALLSPENYHHDPATNLPPADQFRFAVEGHPPQLAPHHDSQKAVHHPEYESPSATFPTPSEMLNDLAGGPSVLPSPPIVGPRVLDSKTETARKARRRAMAENIGFMPTDPCAANPAVPKDPLIPSLSDTISSHEKKRNYLECLEYYVMYLHEQLELVRSRPATLQRVSNPGRGMSSRSIRTVLVHMESVNRRLNQQILAEEQRFVHLRASVSEEAGLQECHMQFNNAQQ